MHYVLFLVFLLTLFLTCQSIFSAGYVHRNISSSNVMLSANGSKGILMDFEHVKAFKEPSPHDEVEKDIFVGEPHFRAIEVPTATFYYFPLVFTESETGRISSNAPQMPWFHNPIHDIESIWWITVWASLAYTRTGLLDEGVLQTTYRRLFPISEDFEPKPDRVSIMKPQIIFTKIYQQPFFDTHISFLRNVLIYAYRVLQSNLQPLENRPIYQETFTYFLDTMQKMRRTIGPLGQAKLKRVEDPLASLDEPKDPFWSSFKKARLR